MRSTSWSRHTRPALVIASAAALVVPAALMTAASSSAATQGVATTGPTDIYVVQVAGNPLTTYAGTRPAPGKKVDVDTPAARSYRASLSKRHQQVLASVRGTATVRDYGVAFNGFAARLTESQADALAKRSDVVRVWKNEMRTATTSRTPDFLGLTGPNGVWQKQFGGNANAGAGMIIGVIDSGIWPENPSFAPLKNPKDQAVIDAKWNGICDGGTGPGKVTCNNKLIGARAYYSAAQIQPFEYKTPRGYNAHGTHVSGTAAGNYGVHAVNGPMDLGTISGMAPAARIAMYKALWATPDGRANGGSVDLVAAIDQAVADGVDVINYSVSGTRDSVVSPDEVAFFNAAQAGVFVSAAAGNEGEDGPSTVNHTAPWDMTVAASTVDRPVDKTVVTGDGVKHTGNGLGATKVTGKLVNSTVAALPGVDKKFAAACFSDIDPKKDGIQPALDPAKIKGAIVLCQRLADKAYSNARVDKSLAVKNAGGIGMVLANTDPTQNLVADVHSVPTVHVPVADGTAIAAYIASAGAKATATINPTGNTPVRAPEIASFSSSGPALAGKGDLLKPDIAAPGVNIIAAASPKGENGNDFASMSGTSMATPHIAGIAALVKAKHPTWSPMAVKSALMTTATTLDNQGQPIQRTGETATPIDMGAGQVVPAKSFDPGLVYDSNPKDWARYACSLGQLQAVTEDGFCDTLGPEMDPSDLNYPSIAIGDLAGTQTVTRTVTNVSGKALTVKARVQQPTGVNVTVSPSTLTVPAGKSATFKVAFTRTAAQFDQFAFGALTWQGKDGLAVRSPLAVRPVTLRVPDEIKGTGANGSKQLRIRAGVTGVFSADVNGLVPDTLAAADTKLGDEATTTVTVPAGTKVARFATYDSDYASPTDLDISVLLDGKEVGASGGPTADENVTLRDPKPGTYTVKVKAFAGNSTINVKTHSYVVAPGPKGNLTVSPAQGTAKVGEDYPVTLTWKGLDASHRYLGMIDAQNNGTDRIGTTIVEIKP